MAADLALVARVGVREESVQSVGDPGALVVELVTVTGASHAWMGHTPSNPAATPAYMELDASVTVLQFLFAHPRAA